MSYLQDSIGRIVEWTKLKCRIQRGGTAQPYFREREIWWASIGENIGSEQNGKNDRYERPVLVLKKISADMFWMLPLTTAKHEGTWFYPTRHSAGEVVQTVVLAQVRTVSAKRLIKKQRTLSIEEFVAIRERMKNFF